MGGGCNGICKLSIFPLELLHNLVVHKYWSSKYGMYRLTKDHRNRHSGHSKKFTKEHRKKGLATCRMCQYITAKPCIDIFCQCCAYRLSRSV